MLVALVGCAGNVSSPAGGEVKGKEVKGKVKTFEPEKNTLTLTVGDQDQTFTLTEETRFVGPNGKDQQDKSKIQQRLKEGAEVTINTEKADGKDVVTKVQLPRRDN
jgi:Cu/Ag efflux protein CusF